jgi:predicted deacylase
VYVHYPDGQLLSFLDARNTNRSWPGRPNGLPTERVTAAVMRLLAEEHVDIALDLHGAETMFPVTNCIVAPEQSMKIATMASMIVTAMSATSRARTSSSRGTRRSASATRRISTTGRCGRPPAAIDLASSTRRLPVSGTIGQLGGVERAGER